MASLAAALIATIAVPGASANPALTPKAVGYAKVSRACATQKPGSATCFALVREPVSSADADQAGVRPYALETPASEAGPAGGLTPAQLARAYGYEPSAGGAGQTIAIVDAYDDPSIESDLETFDSNYGIAPCTKLNGCFTKVSQTGSSTVLPEADKTGWSVESSLDVEAAHSTCPQCKILLVEAKSASYRNLATAVDEAVSLKATEISNSYGGAEEELGAGEQAAYDHPGVVIAAATGDYGYDDWTEKYEGREPPGHPDIPASFPSVVAVGGTTLELGHAGERESETVWNGNGPEHSSRFDEGATGGGCSTLFTAQPWQQDAPGFAATGCGGKRLAADVSADANPYTGFDIYDSYKCGKDCEEFKRGRNWLTIGGTSLSTPLISALYALAGGSDGVSYPALTLYGHLGQSSTLFDVTEGGSGYCDDGGLACGIDSREGLVLDCEGTTACNAAKGYDGPSGVGTPNSLGLFKPLPPAAAITAPTSLAPGSPASFSGATSSDPYPGGSISSYAWSWGDGTPNSSGATPSHTYSAPGEYTVTLTVTDNYGLTSAPLTRSVDVTAGTPQEEERAAAKKAEEEAATRKAEQEAAARKAEEQAARKAEEQAARKAEEQAAAKKAEEAAATGKAEEAASTKLKEQESKRLQEAAQQKQHEEEAKKAGEETAALAKRQEEEAAARSAVNTGAQLVSGFQADVVPTVPDVQLVSTSLHASRSGTVTLKISCPPDETRCSGSATLRTIGRHPALTLASGSFSVPGGKIEAVTLRMSSTARAALSRSRTLRIRATLLAHDPLGASHTTSTIATLSEPARAAAHTLSVDVRRFSRYAR